MLTSGGEIASLRGGLMRVLGMIAREGIIWLGKALSVLLMGAILVFDKALVGVPGVMGC